MTSTDADDVVGHLDHRGSDRLLRRVARRSGGWIGVLTLTSLATAAAATVLPAVLGRAFDAVLGEAPQVWVTRAGLLVALLVGCDLVDDLAIGTTTARSTQWLRHTLLRHLLAVGARSADRFPPGEVASRLVANATDAGSVGPVAVQAVGNLVPAVGGVVALTIIDLWLGVAFVLGVPIFVGLLRAFARDASDIAGRYLEVQGQIARCLADALTGARTIAAAGSVQREIDRALQPLPELHRQGDLMWRAHLRISTQDALLVPLMEILVLGVAGFQLTRGRITPGEMLAAAQYVILASSLDSAVSVVARVAKARAGAGRAAEVLAEAPVSYGEQRLPPGDGRLELRDVTVLRDGQPVLDSVSLVVPAGALAAIVGPSGSGKSLLAAVAGRLVDPDSGAVLIDGTDLRMVERAALRQAVAFGFERPVLVGETLADVIGFGPDALPRDAVVAAARAAQADGFIRRMRHGYETRLADAPMSGGEIQRLGLARAFAHRPRVLVLDDVAASLDTVTEHEISEVLTGELGGRTRIVVSHRAAIAARADLVIWLEKGRLRAVARHHELWREPDYRRLFEATVQRAPEEPDQPEAPVSGDGA